MNLGEEHEIFSRSLRGPRKLLGSDRGATKFFYKNLKFPPAPTRRYWSLNSIYIFSKPLPDKISEIPLHFSSASIGCDTKHSLSLHYFSKKGSDTIVSTPPQTHHNDELRDFKGIVWVWFGSFVSKHSWGSADC